MSFLVAVALAISIPNYFDFDASPDDAQTVTAVVAGHGPAPGAHGSAARGARVPVPIGRDGKAMHVRVTGLGAVAFDRDLGPMWAAAVKITTNVLLVLTGAALVLLRPSRLTWPFFFYAVGVGVKSDAGISFWSFLPVVPQTFVECVFLLLWKIGTVGFALFALRLTAVFPARV